MHQLELPMSANQPLQSSPPAAGYRLTHWLFQPIPIDWLVYFRILFGCIILVEAYRYYPRMEMMYINPTFQFKYYGFEWVQVWPGNGMYLHIIFIGLAACCVMVGFCYRVACLLLFASFTYLFLLDQSYYLNHFYLVCTLSFLLIFLPAHRALSVDVWLRPHIHSEYAPNWTLWLLRIQIAIPYLFGAFAKMESDWLSGVPMAIMLRPDDKPEFFAELFRKPEVIYFFAYSGLLYDLLIVPTLLWRRTRWLGVIGVIIFNTTNHFLFTIGIFPWLMMFSTVLFFPPDSLRKRWLPKLKTTGAEQSARWVSGPKPIIITTLLILLLSFQFLVPFRHFLYPGHANWTEEGHRFAWHMKLRVKRATQSKFYSFSQSGELLEEYDPADYLTERQFRTMATRPDMILQFAHFLAEEYARKHHGERVLINVFAEASLNRRAPQLIIDPNVNLAAMPRNLKHADWIEPLRVPKIEMISAEGRTKLLQQQQQIEP